jgi:hypothetical protein
MATERYYCCSNCKAKTLIDKWLYDALLDNTKGVFHACDVCSNPCTIELNFNFGLGAGPLACKVLASFLPEKIRKWLDEDGKRVEFYPFMVVVEEIEEGNYLIWLAYWHIKYHDWGIERKYGQWAPLIDEELYSSLLNKAKAAGYL